MAAHRVDDAQDESGSDQVNGWVSVSRKMVEHPLFEGDAQRIGVWVWMLMTAAWKDTRQKANGKTVEVKRGQLLTSYRQMSRATGASVKTLRTLVRELSDEGAVGTDKGTGRLLITICNYEKYQDSEDGKGTRGAQQGHRGGHARGTAKAQGQGSLSDCNESGKWTSENSEGTAGAQQGHTGGTQNEQDNNSDYVGQPASGPVVDPVKVLFDSGVRLLGQAGIPNPKARSLLGKWRRDHSDGAVIEALGRAQREAAIDPVAFIEGALRWSAKKADIEDNRPRDPFTGQLMEVIR